MADINVSQINSSLLAIAQAQNGTTLAITNKFGTFVTVPANSSAAGVPGQCAYDATHFYLCVGVNSWLRFTGSTF